MKIAILLEPMGTGYRASGGEPFSISVEGATRDEALDKLKVLVRARLNAGAEVVELDVGPAEHPLLKFSGMFKEDDPIVQEWLQIMAENRDNQR